MIPVNKSDTLPTNYQGKLVRSATAPTSEDHDHWKLRLGLAEVARRSVQRAQAEPQWVGSADLGFLLAGSSQLFEIRPVLSPEGVIGLILSDEGAANGEAISAEARASSAPAIPSRIVGVRDGRALMLSSIEIRYAEARRHDVWLATDRGWMRAATHGLDNVVDELTKFGFVRIHRSYVVNIARICEVQHHGKGVLTLSTTRGNKRQSRCRGVTRSS